MTQDTPFENLWEPVHLFAREMAVGVVELVGKETI